MTPSLRKMRSKPSDQVNGSHWRFCGALWNEKVRRGETWRPFTAWVWLVPGTEHRCRARVGPPCGSDWLRGDLRAVLPLRWARATDRAGDWDASSSSQSQKLNHGVMRGSKTTAVVLIDRSTRKR